MIEVVHISTFANGGAGRAAFRLHEGLQKLRGINSTFISASNDGNNGSKDHIEVLPRKITLYEKILNNFKPSTINSYRNVNLLKGFVASHEYFSLPESDYRVELIELVKNADIVNLHWISNFVNYPSFFDSVKNKHIVWTMHDMNPLLGGHHYKNAAIGDIPNRLLEQKLSYLKREHLRKIENLTVVSPSKWLLQEAVSSKVFNTSTQYEYIPYSIDTEKFRPYNKEFAKKYLGIKADSPCFMIVGEDLTSHRKGFDLFCKAILAIKNDFQVLTVGSNKLNIKGNFQLKELGTVEDDELLMIAYAAADLLVLPSREDNLPNVMLEAFACGTPVLAFQVGGMVDWIVPGFNGLLAPQTDEFSLLNELEKFINNPDQFESQQIRKFAIDNFSLDLQAKKYADLYTSILDINS